MTHTSPPTTTMSSTTTNRVAIFVILFLLFFIWYMVNSLLFALKHWQHYYVINERNKVVSILHKDSVEQNVSTYEFTARFDDNVLRLTTMPFTITEHTLRGWRSQFADRYSSLHCSQKSRFCDWKNQLCYVQRGGRQFQFVMFGDRDHSGNVRTNEWFRNITTVHPSSEFTNERDWKVWRVHGTTFLYSLPDMSDLYSYMSSILSLYEYISTEYVEKKPNPRVFINQIMNIQSPNPQSRLIEGFHNHQQAILNTIKWKLLQMFHSSVLKYSGKKGDNARPLDVPLGYSELFIPHMTPQNYSITLPKNTLLCFDNAVLPWFRRRPKPFFVNPEVIDMLKSDVSKAFDLPPSEYFTRDKTRPPPYVTILGSRQLKIILENYADIVEQVRRLAKEYKLTVLEVSLEEVTDFSELVRICRTTGFLISAQGIHLMNALFLPKGASLLEIFPYKNEMRYSHLFSVPLQAMGINYQPLYSDVGRVVRDVNTDKINKCLRYGADAAPDEKCLDLFQTVQLRWDFTSPSSELRMKLVDAMKHITPND